MSGPDSQLACRVRAARHDADRTRSCPREETEKVVTGREIAAREEHGGAYILPRRTPFALSSTAPGASPGPHSTLQ